MGVDSPQLMHFLFPPLDFFCPTIRIIFIVHVLFMSCPSAITAPVRHYCSCPVRSQAVQSTITAASYGLYSSLSLNPQFLLSTWRSSSTCIQKMIRGSRRWRGFPTPAKNGVSSRWVTVNYYLCNNISLLCAWALELYWVLAISQIVNHGIPHSLMDGIKGVAKEFFNLPLQEKQKYGLQAGVNQGCGKTLVIVEDRMLYWGDLLALVLMPNNLKKFVFSYCGEVCNWGGKSGSSCAEFAAAHCYDLLSLQSLHMGDEIN